MEIAHPESAHILWYLPPKRLSGRHAVELGRVGRQTGAGWAEMAVET